MSDQAAQIDQLINSLEIEKSRHRKLREALSVSMNDGLGNFGHSDIVKFKLSQMFAILYVVVVIVMMAGFLVGASFLALHQWDYDKKGLDPFTVALVELMKVAVLPVITFVIGHYFGAQSDAKKAER